MPRLILVLVATLAVLAQPVPLPAAEGAGVYRSDDGGRTWIHLAGSPPVDSIFSLTIDPTFPARIHLASDRAIWLSDDAGASWRLAATRALREDQVAFALQVDPFRPGRVWAGTEIGILLSEDDGMTWALAPGSPPTTAMGAGAPEGDPRLLAGGADGLQFSDDDGQRWEPESDGIEGAVLAIAVAADGERLVGTSVGVFVKPIDEERFEAARGLPRGAARAVVYPGDGTALAAVGSTLYRRTSGWTRVASLPLASTGDPPGITSLLQMTDGRVLVGTDHGLHSSDGWALVPPFDGLSHLEIGAMVADPTRPERIYLGASAVPHAFGLARVGISFNASVAETGDERFAVIIAVLFLVGGVMAVRYLNRVGAQPKS